MKTYRLWLEPDPVVPRFLQLAVGRVDVPAADVFEKGVHPIWNFEDPATREEAFVERPNSPDVKLPHRQQLGYCENADAIPQARYCGSRRASANGPSGFPSSRACAC